MPGPPSFPADCSLRRADEHVIVAVAIDIPGLCHAGPPSVHRSRSIDSKAVSPVQCLQIELSRKCGSAENDIGCTGIFDVVVGPQPRRADDQIVIAVFVDVAGSTNCVSDFIVEGEATLRESRCCRPDR